MNKGIVYNDFVFDVIDCRAILKDYIGNRAVIKLPETVFSSYDNCTYDTDLTIPSGSFNSAKNVEYIVCTKPFEFDDFVFCNSKELKGIIVLKTDYYYEKPVCNELSFATFYDPERWIPISLLDCVHKSIDEYEEAYKKDDANTIGELADYVLVPIKDILTLVTNRKKVEYSDDVVTMLRKYFVAGLNLRYFEVQDLYRLVNKFVSKVDDVRFTDEIDELDNITEYNYQDKVLTVFDGENSSSTKLFGCDYEPETKNISKFDLDDYYAVRFYRAITEILFLDNHRNIDNYMNCMFEMIAEQIHSMDLDEMPRFVKGRKEYLICGKKYGVVYVYERNHFTCNMITQLLLAIGLGETKLFNSLFKKSIETGFADFGIDSKKSESLLSMISYVFGVETSSQTDVNDERMFLKVISEYEKQIESIIKNSDDDLKEMIFLANKVYEK